MHRHFRHIARTFTLIIVAFGGGTLIQAAPLLVIDGTTGAWTFQSGLGDDEWVYLDSVGSQSFHTWLSSPGGETDVAGFDFTYEEDFVPAKFGGGFFAVGVSPEGDILNVAINFQGFPPPTLLSEFGTLSMTPGGADIDGGIFGEGLFTSNGTWILPAFTEPDSEPLTVQVVNVVPEPSVLGLVTFAGVLAWRRRR